MTGVGDLVRSFFEDYLRCQRGLRPASVRSYRDALKLFLVHAAGQLRQPLTRLTLADLTCERVLEFLNWLERERGNGARTRNQHLAALRGFFRYAAARCPEALAEAQRVEAIPTKRSSSPAPDPTARSNGYLPPAASMQAERRVAISHQQERVSRHPQPPAPNPDNKVEQRSRIAPG